ncbi:unnamed protein product [Cylicocyclus nassatus]|uniref:Uncharacterized protein n=1 Tax=Cylicocyclus nassatus TaxID=53992 RepID=A0AA36MAN7_CYLNA|nr:unnamed protein product [Cylicocyclus nassatus]CAJ0603613.1 unnamed protein product [Cylicocyclus nassatus]CAJ0603635.1 unnamed protein product [Cylicocyclus nassatus]
MPDGTNDRKFRCLYGTTHASLVTKFIVAYIAIECILLMQLPLPPYTFIISLFGFAICTCTVIAIIIRSSRLLMPLYFFVVGSIFFLFFLGGYYFYVNIFHKDIVIAAFGEKFDEYSWIAHLLDVLLLMLHYWQLGVISKCRRFYQYIRVEDKQPLELQLRSETKEEFA